MESLTSAFYSVFNAIFVPLVRVVLLAPDQAKELVVLVVLCFVLSTHLLFLHLELFLSES